MSAAEFASWIAYYRLDPWGESRADLRAGIIASTTANCHATKRGVEFKPSDFMPKFEIEKAKVQTWQEMAAKMKAFSQTHNARIGKAVANGA